MQLKLLMLFSSLLLWRGSHAFAQDTTYIWQSADGDPFNIQGTIVLDSPSSENGSPSDVVSMRITDTLDTFSWIPADAQLYNDTPYFEWNQSQILEMDLVTPGPLQDSADAVFEANPNGTGAIFDNSNPPPGGPLPNDQSGEWVAPGTVPEPSTIVLLLFGGATFVAARRHAAARRPASPQRGNRFD